jgi:hypothetical protein
MDPKKLAEEILEKLFENQEELFEEQDMEENEEEEEEDSEEDDSEDESEDYNDEEDEETSAQGGSSQSNQASVAMKGSPVEGSAANGGGTRDLSGKGVQPFPGVNPAQEFTTTEVNAQANQASIAMKGFGSVEAPVLNKEQVEQDLKTLFGADVSDEFIAKASSLYEASLNTNLQTITEQMSVIFEEKLAESVVMVAEELENRVSDYLTYVVEEWVKENQLAVDNGLRTEIAENFIDGLKNLFAESYIEVPEDKTSIFDEMVDAIDNLETRVNEEMEKNMTLRDKIALLEATAVFAEETKNLKTIDAENLRKLAENVEFSSSDDFRSKVKVLVENYSKAKNSPIKSTKPAQTDTEVGAVIDNLMEEAEANQEQEFVSESIKLYSNVLGRTLEG